MDEPDEFIKLDGHLIDPTKLDRFYNGDGTRVTDEEWDEDKRRAIAGLAGEDIVGLNITTELPEGHEFGTFEGND